MRGRLLVGAVLVGLASSLVVGISFAERAGAVTAVAPGSALRLVLPGFDDVSNDGRFIVFTSTASTLVAGDTNGVRDVFRLDRDTNQVQRVSVNTSEAQANSESSGAAISANGRFVAFRSSASNLVGGDTNRQADVFLRDVVSGTTERISLLDNEGQTEGGSFGADVSNDGRIVIFMSVARNLLVSFGGGQYASFDGIYVRDRLNGSTRMIAGYDELVNMGVFDQLVRPELSDDGSTALWGAAFFGTSGDVGYTSINATATATLQTTVVDALVTVTDYDISANGRRIVASENSSSPYQASWYEQHWSKRHPFRGLTHVYDLNSGTQVATMPGLSSAISADGGTVFGGSSHALRAMKVSTRRIEIVRVGRGSFTVLSALLDGANALIRTDTPNLAPSDANESEDYFVVGAGAASPTPTIAHVHDVALQPDGKIVVVGDRETTDGQTRLTVARYTAAGALDMSFSGDGLIPSTITTTEAQVAVQPGTGRILILIAPLKLIAYTAAGVIDGSFTQWTAYEGRRVGDVRVDADGKIVVIGSSAPNRFVCGFNGWGGYSCSEITLARLNPNGRPDLTFDGDGVATYGEEEKDLVGMAVAFMDDGYLVGTNRGAARFTSGGQLDGTFGDETGFLQPSVDSESVIVLGGQPYTAGAYVGGFIVTRLTPDGDVDPSYSENGSAVIEVGHWDGQTELRALVPGPSGSLYAIGWSDQTVNMPQFAVVRLSATGDLDPTFSGDGVLTPRLVAGGWGVAGGAVRVSSSLLLVGSVAPSWDRSVEFGLTRVTSSGAFDTTFGGGDGIVTRRFVNR